MKPKPARSVWTPIKRRLPDVGTYCWIARRGRVFLARRDADSWVAFGPSEMPGLAGRVLTYRDSSDERITHWTPAKPPEGPTT